MGRFEVRLNGETLKLPLSKAEELLTFLVLRGPASRAELTDALWNGSREQKHAKYCRVVIRKLRAALATYDKLEKDPLPYVEGKYHLSEEFEVSCDTLGVLGQTVQPPSSAFLPSVDSEWVMDLLGQLERSFEPRTLELN